MRRRVLERSAVEEFRLASELLDRGSAANAFRLFLRAAVSGDPDAQVNVGWMYDTGTGVRKDLKEALRWYRRAFGQGSAIAATNIGTIYRDLGNRRRALEWFWRSIRAGDVGSLLEIAKLQALRPRGRRDALASLRSLLQAASIDEASREEAAKMLAALSRDQPKAVGAK